ncbi:MAG: metallophosphoesterase [Woeseiaceae bacterium]|nr:metallophosphoesterase [Woeseiaceae bacterium]
MPFLLLVILLLSVPAAASWQFDGVERVVAVSDVHGAHPAFATTLKGAGVIDNEQSWSGGKSHLVVVGDLLDRGPDSRRSMDLLMKLEQEAEAAGGKVHVLIGNHEAMNLIGDLRYVAAGEYEAFAREETEDERNFWFEKHRESRETPDYSREAFDKAFPPGYFAHRRAFAADGHYGAWLLSKPVIVVINQTAFVHGGVSPMVGEYGLDGVNGKLVGEMAEYLRLLDRLYAEEILLPTDNFYDHPGLLEAWMPPIDSTPELLDSVAKARILNASRLHDSDGPLWYRGNAACSRVIEETRLLETLEIIGANRVVIGHTPTPTRRILSRLDGAIVEVDTGMNRRSYGGTGNALLIEAGELSAINEVGAEAYPVQAHPRQVGTRPGGFLSLEDTLDLLATGEVVEEITDEQGRQVVRLQKDGRSLEAVFSPRSARGFYPELAAFALDQLLELDMVPATVRRKLGRKDGTLQFLVPDTLNEEQRSASGRGSGAQCPLLDQWDAMYVFDSLIHNEARTRDRMLYDREAGWDLVLVGHSRSFSTKKGVPDYLSGIDLNLTQSWRKGLTSLADDVLDVELEDALDKRRRKALADRRDLLLSD